MVILGIDPGLDGALVVMSYTTGKVVESVRMPTVKRNKRSHLDGEEIAAWVREVDEVWIEAQRAMTKGQGPGSKRGIASTGTTMRNFGILEGICFGTGTPYNAVQPQVWQRWAVPAAPSGEDIKDYVIAAVTREYPELDLLPGKCRKPHSGLADACMVAAYGCMQIAELE